MSKKIISNLHNSIGNQMFIYASSYAIAKKYNRRLYLDNETNFYRLKYKNTTTLKIKYSLDCFNLPFAIADEEDKFVGYFKYIKLKILKFIDKFKNKKDKSFINEYRNDNKISKYQKNILSGIKTSKIFLNGHFESEKYFLNIKDEIKNHFVFKNEIFFKKNKLYSKIKKSNSLAICIRRHRFSEKINKVTSLNLSDSDKFTLEQVEYIKKGIKIFDKKIKNYRIFLWSNDYRNIEKLLNLKKVNLVKTNNEVLDLFLMSNCKYFITIPSTFNWWGAWLSGRKGKKVFRPHESNFTKFKVNNIDFWPKEWSIIK